MTNLTQLHGTLGFLLSSFFLGCVLYNGWRKNVDNTTLYFWLIMLIISILSLVEIQFSFRFFLKHFLVDVFVSYIPYSERRYFQVILACLFLAILTPLFLILFRTRKCKMCCKFGVFGSSVTMILFLLEAVSLHAVDALMYSEVLNIMVIGWLWSSGALLMSIGAYLELKKSLNLLPS